MMALKCGGFSVAPDIVHPLNENEVMIVADKAKVETAESGTPETKSPNEQSAARKRSFRAQVTRSVKRTTIVVAISFVACVGIVGAAWAFVVNEVGTSFNLFTSKEVVVSVVENDVVMNVDEIEMAFGESAKRVGLAIPELKSDAYVRVTFTPQIVALDSPDENSVFEFFDGGSLSEPIDNKAVFADITLHFTDGWEADWLYQDGFFYYREVLEAGTKSPELLQGVTQAGTIEGTVEVVITAEGIQPQTAAVQSAWGVSL